MQGVLKQDRIAMSYYLARFRWLLSRLLLRGRSRNGQAMLEYVIGVCAVTTFTAILVILLLVFREESERAVDLIGSEYP